jgi:hypothetical protein
MPNVKMFVENKKNQIKSPVGESDKPPGDNWSTVVSCPVGRELSTLRDNKVITLLQSSNTIFFPRRY